MGEEAPEAGSGAKEKGRGHMGDGREVAGGPGGSARLGGGAERGFGDPGGRGPGGSGKDVGDRPRGGERGRGGEQEMVGAGTGLGAFEEAQERLGLARRRS